MRLRDLVRRDRTPIHPIAPDLVLPDASIERRDPTAATRSLRYTTPGRPQPPDWDASQAFERAYYANVVAYACVQAIAATISSLPFRAGPDPDQPTNFDTNAPLARLLGPPPGGPNPNMSGEELWFFAIAQWLVTGRFGWEIETPTGSEVPAALWPLVSSSLTPIPSQSGTRWWDGFTYGRPGDLRRLTPDQCFYAHNPRGSDFRQPESAFEAAHLDINVAVMQSRYDYAFLKNDARPPAVVVTEEFEDADSFEAFKRQFNSEHRGPENAGRIAFAEAKGGGEQGVKGAVSIETLGFSPKDAQAAQRHAAAMQHIAMAIGVPWSRLDASGRTFDNASEEDKIWWQQRLIPLIRRLQSAVNIQLAPRLGNQVGWFDLSKIPVLKERPEPLSAKVGAPALVQAQIMQINEARADYGLPSVPDGDRFMTPEEIAALSGTSTPGEVARVLSEFEERTRTVEPPAPVAPAPVIEVETRELTAEEHELRRARIWVASNATVVNLERIWERAWRRIFTRQERSAIARLEAKRGRTAVTRTAQGDTRAAADEIFDIAHWTAETEDETRALYEQVTAAGGARVSNLFGIAFDLDAPYAQEFVHRRANQLAGPVTQTTYEGIQGALGEGIAAGEGVPTLAGRVRGVFEEARSTRATTIARTEVISAYNGSAVVVASQLGSDVVGGQEWITTIDGRTRDWHAERDGEIVGIGDVFSGGLAYPGDPGGDPADVVNCRCTVAFLTPDEFAEFTGSSTGRMVDRRTAVAVLALVRPGEFDEGALRAALREAA